MILSSPPIIGGINKSINRWINSAVGYTNLEFQGDVRAGDADLGVIKMQRCWKLWDWMWIMQESMEIGTRRGPRTPKSQWRRKNQQKEWEVTSLKVKRKPEKSCVKTYEKKLFQEERRWWTELNPTERSSEINTKILQLNLATWRSLETLTRIRPVESWDGSRSKMRWWMR